MRTRPAGMALVFALTLIFLLAILSWAFLNFSDQSMLLSRRVGQDVQAFHAAEGGIRFLMTRPDWSSPGAYELELTTAEVTVTVTVAEDTIVAVSTARSGSVEREIELTLSKEGQVLDRVER